jgi:DNA repair protein RadD
VYQPRWYLEEALDATFSFFNEVGGLDDDGGIVRANPVIAMPTGTGKSHYISQLIFRALHMFPETRIINATHVKELVDQNAKRLQEQWPDAPIGVHSAGLKRRDTAEAVIFGGIQSMKKVPEELGKRDLLLVDEAHLISPNTDTTYGNFITNLQLRNPYLKTIAITATPYRLGLGHLTNGPIFSHTAYDITNIDGFGRLIAEGYLCPPISKKTAAAIDVSKLRIGSNGDYSEASMDEALSDEITFEALKEIVQYGWDRRSWMIFAPNIERCEKIAHMLRTFFGVPTAAVHSKSSTADRDIEAFKYGALRCIVNVDKLTTGFDHPPVDLIGMLRPTMSPGLWVQMLGRGTRPFPGKLNCLVLDFAGNTKRLGPINDPVIPRPRGSGPPGDSPVKICACGVYNHSSARVCDGCGAEFPINEKAGPGYEAEAGTEELLRSDLPQVEYFDVQRVVYDVHKSLRHGGESLKVVYYCAGMKSFFEYIKFEGAKPYAIHKAHDWLRQRTPAAEWAIKELPNHVGNMHYFIAEGSSTFRTPRRISVWINTAKPQVMNYEF